MPAASAASLSSTVYDDSGTPLIVIAGQSNAVGQGNTFFLDTTPGLANLFGSVLLNDQRGADALDPITWSFGATRALQPYAAPGVAGMGIELSLGRALRALGIAPLIGKFAVNGAGLNAHFLPSKNYPTSPAGKNLFGQLVDYIDARVAEAGRSLAVLIWIQGETDAYDATPAGLYAANLTQFVSALRDHFGNFAFVFNKLSSSMPLSPTAFRDTVRTQQDLYLSTASHAFVVNIDDIPVGDGSSVIHYDGIAQASMGYRFADVVAPLLTPDVVPAPRFVGGDIGVFGPSTLNPRWGGVDYQDGDIGILAVVGFFENTPIVLSDAQGFTAFGSEIVSLFSGLRVRLRLYWARASGTMAAPTIASAGLSFQSARIAIFRGCVATGSPIDAVASDANNNYNSTTSAPGATTTGARRLAVSFCGGYQGAPGNTFAVTPNTDFFDQIVAAYGEQNFGSGNVLRCPMLTTSRIRSGAFIATTIGSTLPTINASTTFALRAE